jgi:hypothetical protein
MTGRRAVSKIVTETGRERKREREKERKREREKERKREREKERKREKAREWCEAGCTAH